jgi:hypothetical protein
MAVAWRRRLVRGLGTAATLVLLSCVWVAPASADTGIFVVKGVDAAGTPQSSVVAQHDGVPATIEVLRDGAAVPDGPGFDLQVGDVIRVLDASSGALLATTTFDGNPALSPTTCIGSTTFAGTRTAGANVVDVSAFKRTAVPPDEDVITGQVQSQTASAISGTFPRAIPAGHTVSATELLTLSGTVTLIQVVERRVADCPVPGGGAPPPPPPPPPAGTGTGAGTGADPGIGTAPGTAFGTIPGTDTTRPTGKLTVPAFLSRSGLISARGLALKATIGEPGTIRVSVYVDNGAKLPTLKAGAAAAKAKPVPKLIRIAYGQKTVKAGALNVTIRTTGVTRPLVKSRKRIRAVIVTTLTDAAGNKRLLPAKKTTIR